MDKDSLILTSGSAEYLDTCSLVLSAVSIPHTIRYDDQILLVPETYFADASRELDAYFSENRDWPPAPPDTSGFTTSETPPTFLMMFCLALFHRITGPWVAGNSWFEAGAVQSDMILQRHEWWRLFTALTLHADEVHLLGNCIIGGFLIHLLSRTIGYGSAWLLAITTAGLANFLNIFLRTHSHSSVGFSTAVFAAVGILTGLQLHFRKRPAVKQLLLPLGAGCGLLALLGSEGQQTDLGAHFFGFLCGIPAGMLFAPLKLNALTARAGYQALLFLTALSILILPWLLT